MALTTTLTDDLDGTMGAEERRYSIGNVNYAIDLTDANYAKMLEIMEPYRSRSRVAQKSRKSRFPVLTDEDRLKIRDWAAETGRPLAARGRFPNALVSEYYSELAKQAELISV